MNISPTKINEQLLEQLTYLSNIFMICLLVLTIVSFVTVKILMKKHILWDTYNVYNEKKNSQNYLSVLKLSVYLTLIVSSIFINPTYFFAFLLVFSIFIWMEVNHLIKSNKPSFYQEKKQIYTVENKEGKEKVLIVFQNHLYFSDKKVYKINTKRKEYLSIIDFKIEKNVLSYTLCFLDFKVKKVTYKIVKKEERLPLFGQLQND